MPLRLNVGASRKVTDNNYGSRGAAVHLDLELEAGLIAEPDTLRERIRDLFGLVRASLADELNGHGAGHDHGHPAPRTNGHAGPPSRPSGNGSGGFNEERASSPRPATPSQVKALYAIARSKGIDLVPFLHDRFQVRRANDLSISQASAAIDGLKAADVCHAG